MSDNSPINEPINRKRVQPIKTKMYDIITLDNDEDTSDKDETEGEYEDIVHSNSDEEDGNNSNTEKSVNVIDSVIDLTLRKTHQSKMVKLNKNAVIQPCFLIFDSMTGANRTGVVATLRDYLRNENKAKGRKDRDIANTIRGASLKVPQQTNFTDCGLYLLQYVESFFKNPIQNCRLTMRSLANWFPKEVVNCKREYIHKLLLSLIEKSGGDISSLNLPKFTSST